MKKRFVSLFLCVALLASILAVPGMVATADTTITWQDGATGQYAVLDAVPTDTPLNVGKHIQQGTTGTNFNANGGNVSYLTDGNLDNHRQYYFSDTSAISFWEKITIPLGVAQTVDRLFIASQEAGARHVYVKFYASTDLATLYDASNLMAETKDGLGTDELNILLKGEAKEASYVGVETYIPHASNEAAKYPSIAGFGSQFRLRELAVYAVSTTPSPDPEPEAPKADEYGYYAADTGKYKVIDFVPGDTPLNVDCHPCIKTSSTRFNANGGNISYLTDGNLDNLRMYYFSNTSATGYWEDMHIDLGSAQTVERLFVASDAVSSRHVAVKFYASTTLTDLFDDANLMAARDGFGETELNFLLKGTAKEARYVGISTYIPNPTADKATYPGIGSLASQFRFRELAVYGAATGEETDAEGFYAADIGKYKVTDTLPIDTPVNQGVDALQGSTTTKYANAGGNVALLTDGSLTTGLKKYYQKVDNSVGVWEYFTFPLNGTYKVDKMFIGSETASTRQVSVKFYASDKLATLYDDANLIAAKDGLGEDQLNILLKGEAKEADYVGLATYVPNTSVDTQYTGVGGRASQVRFTELAVYGTFVPDLFNATVITSDNYQTALPTGDNLLLGKDVDYKPADYLQMLKPTGAVWADVTAGEGVYNQANLTDGKMNGINTTDSNVGSLKNFASTAFVYDLRGTVDISHLLIQSSKEDNSANYFVNTLEVYVSDSLDTLLTEANLVDTLTFTMAENVKLFATNTEMGTVKGRYIAFKPNYCQYGSARFGELGVYGTYESGPRDFDREVFAETVITADNYQTALPAGKNLLLGEDVEGKPEAYLQMLRPDGSPWGAAPNSNSNGLTNYANIVDGKMNGINTTDSNVGSLKNFDQSAFVYDLRGTVDISSLLVHAAKEDNSINYMVSTLEVYVGDTLDTLLTDDCYVQTVSFTLAENVKVLTPTEELKGRYVAFKPKYCQYSIARFGELGVYGTYETGPMPFDEQIVQGKLPVDYYYAPMGDPGTRLSTFPAMKEEGNEDNANPLTVLTNGLTTDRMDLNLQTAIGDAGDGFEWGDGGKLLQGVPWVVLVYYLEGTVNVNSIALTSPAGSLATAGADFYVGTLQADLFKSENRVYTTNGEKTYFDEEAQMNYLDPAYNKSQTMHSADLSAKGGVSGRYVGIVITRPYATDKQGWGYARLSEVEIAGQRVDYDPAFTEDMHIWTDAATGITADLSRINNDDMAFFQNIGGMTVIKTAIPSTLERDVDDNWLAVDGDYTYTIQLKDKAGNVISDAEMGERYWKISFPNEDGAFRMMGLLNDGTATRIRHSYTSADDHTVIVGNDMKLPATMITGNDLTFVYLKYNSLEYIEQQNGIGDTEFVPAITAGVSDEKVPDATWWLVGLAALVLAGCVCMLMLARRARQ